MIELRRARLADACELARVHVESWAETYRGLMPDAFLESRTSPARLERRQVLWQQRLEAGQDSVFVAEQTSTLVGFTSGLVVNGRPDGRHSSGSGTFEGYDTELFTLYLFKSAQGGGTGRALVQALAADLAARNHASLMLWVLDVNPARAFYEHPGGVVIGEKTEAAAGGELREVAYGWAELGTLL